MPKKKGPCSPPLGSKPGSERTGLSKERWRKMKGCSRKKGGKKVAKVTNPGGGN